MEQYLDWVQTKLGDDWKEDSWDEYKFAFEVGSMMLSNEKKANKCVRIVVGSIRYGITDIELRIIADDSETFQAVYNMGFKNAMMYFGGGIIGLSFVSTNLATAGGATPISSNKEWAAATKEYLKFQNMNPIGIGGRKSYSPEYNK